MALQYMGDTPVATPATSSSSFSDAVHSPTVKAISAMALVYHGYSRTGSIVWALLYGLAGRLIPTVAVPVAIAQGFGERKPCP